VTAMNTGKNYLDQNQASSAIDAFSKALQVDPTSADAHLDLAISYLFANQPDKALKEAQEALNLDHNLAAAHYVKGCAANRLGQFDTASKDLQEAAKLDPTVAAVHYQLGVAYQQLKQWNEAVECFRATLTLDTNHPAAHYNLGQALLRAGQPDEAAQELQKHQGAPVVSPVALEKCKLTEAKVPIQIEEPEAKGVAVHFVDVTADAFGTVGTNGGFKGPVGIIDIHHDGNNGLFVAEGNGGFRLLTNSSGKFYPLSERIRGIEGATYSKCLVGDLQHDRNEDVIVLGPKGTHVFKFATNGVISDATAFSRLQGLTAVDGVLADFDFTGKLDLVAVSTTNAIKVFRNLGGFFFKDVSSTSIAPALVTPPKRIVLEDLNNDDIMDLLIGSDGKPPFVLLKERGGPLLATNLPPTVPNAVALAAGDLNNDLRSDVVLATDNEIVCSFTGGQKETRLSLQGQKKIRAISLIDYDNDGWLDIFAVGDGVRAWRNLGRGRFEEVTKNLGLDSYAAEQFESIAAADFNNDCATDLLLVSPPETVPDGKLGFRLLRNEGASSHRQLKLQLLGNRSNASGLGVRVEVTAGGLRLLRTVAQLPVEIGIGNHAQLDSVTVRWFDLAVPYVDVKTEACAQIPMFEQTLPNGSCPNLYAWDGRTFRFVTDILGASPMGLPLNETRLIDADVDEYVWIGNEKMFPPRGAEYVLQITEELREVLYLDEAKLVMVDHPAGTEVHPTDKLVPGKPFPPSRLVTLENRYPLQRALGNEGQDVTAILAANDGNVLSPPKLRPPQLRGLAEPHSVILDFGPLPVERPLVLAMTGWLKFGGGMANVAAAQTVGLPFPFPQLEAERPDGQWQPLNIVVGAPAGKTKTILVDLTGKLPTGTRRLRLTEAFEIHWDRIALFERRPTDDSRLTVRLPDATHLHWRGFSEYKNLPWFVPLTPDYEKVRQTPLWRITPGGWCTRYGPVDELVARADNALVLLNGGDELTLRFNAETAPAKPAGFVRDFFLYSVGWDKDSDFHVVRGDTVGPMPYQGMDDQRYGLEVRPEIENADWTKKYNTRWVGPMTLMRDK